MIKADYNMNMKEQDIYFMKFALEEAGIAF